MHTAHANAQTPLYDPTTHVKLMWRGLGSLGTGECHVEAPGGGADSGGGRVRVRVEAQ